MITARAQSFLLILSVVFSLGACAQLPKERLMPKGESILSGKCVRCLANVQKDIAHEPMDCPLEKLQFTITEDDDECTIVVMSSELVLGGDRTFTCNKNSGKILKKEYGK